MKSILQDNKDYCYICGKYIYGITDEHHIFGGTANRKKSEEDGMKVYVHRVCHNFVHRDITTNLNYKARCQKIWEQTYGDREAFIKRYGKDYIYMFEQLKKGEINEQGVRNKFIPRIGFETSSKQ